jgi:hypothetical protein
MPRLKQSSSDSTFMVVASVIKTFQHRTRSGSHIALTLGSYYHPAKT